LKQEILIKLKTAEQEAAQRTAGAREEAIRLVQEARRQAAKILEDAQAKARDEAGASLDAQRARLEAEKEKILGAGRQREQAVRDHFQAHVDAAVKKAVKTFEGSLDA
jgi:V/A-type H+-transporting ATPase subunit G/H